MQSHTLRTAPSYLEQNTPAVEDHAHLADSLPADFADRVHLENYGLRMNIEEQAQMPAYLAINGSADEVLVINRMKVQGCHKVSMPAR